MGHDLSQYSAAHLAARIDDIADGVAEGCLCDDFEVDDGIVIRRCARNDIDQLEAELAKRDMAVNR